jgi:hypothetical protein
MLRDAPCTVHLYLSFRFLRLIIIEITLFLYFFRYVSVVISHCRHIRFVNVFRRSSSAIEATVFFFCILIIVVFAQIQFFFRLYTYFLILIFVAIFYSFSF